jgi:hypothetical protein
METPRPFKIENKIFSETFKTISAKVQQMLLVTTVAFIFLFPHVNGYYVTVETLRHT